MPKVRSAFAIWLCSGVLWGGVANLEGQSSLEIEAELSGLSHNSLHCLAKSKARIGMRTLKLLNVGLLGCHDNDCLR